jgi:hypothetical protein
VLIVRHHDLVPDSCKNARYLQNFFLKKIYDGFCTQFQTGSSSAIAIAHAWCALRVMKQFPWLAAPLFLVFEVYSDLVIFFGWGNLASDFFHD